MADLRLAAWLVWMTPLLAALSSSREAVRSWVLAVAASPLSAASRNLRTAVLSSDFTALLRSRRRSFCPMRLICDLMLATPDYPRSRESDISQQGYQRPVAPREPKIIRPSRCGGGASGARPRPALPGSRA